MHYKLKGLCHILYTDVSSLCHIARCTVSKSAPVCHYNYTCHTSKTIQFCVQCVQTAQKPLVHLQLLHEYWYPAKYSSLRDPYKKDWHKIKSWLANVNSIQIKIDKHQIHQRNYRKNIIHHLNWNICHIMFIYQHAVISMYREYTPYLYQVRRNYVVKERNNIPFCTYKCAWFLTILQTNNSELTFAKTGNCPNVCHCVNEAIYKTVMLAQYSLQGHPITPNPGKPRISHVDDTLFP